MKIPLLLCYTICTIPFIHGSNNEQPREQVVATNLSASWCPTNQKQLVQMNLTHPLLGSTRYALNIISKTPQEINSETVVNPLEALTNTYRTSLQTLQEILLQRRNGVIESMTIGNVQNLLIWTNPDSAQTNNSEYHEYFISLFADPEASTNCLSLHKPLHPKPCVHQIMQAAVVAAWHNTMPTNPEISEILTDVLNISTRDLNNTPFGPISSGLITGRITTHAGTSTITTRNNSSK